MKVSGFTFVKNAVKYGYPLVESVKSILPLVDEMIISAGDSEDTTDELIASINSDKIKVVRSTWDNSLRKGGAALAAETDKAFAATSPDADWLFYIQADEVLHEKYYAVIREAMEKYKDDKNVEGLLFHYLHFYGSFRFLADGRKWYIKEVRVIKNDRSIRSYRDAQGFRIGDGRKLKVKQIKAYMYHYGWVRNPVIMHSKVKDFGRYWNDDDVHEPWAREWEKNTQRFDYSKIDSLRLFEGTHPAIMKDLVDKENWEFSRDIKKKNFKTVKHKLLYFIWRKTGWRPFAYKNYKKI